jgi:hypothetical protein
MSAASSFRVYPLREERAGTGTLSIGIGTVLLGCDGRCKGKSNRRSFDSPPRRIAAISAQDDRFVVLQSFEAAEMEDA